MLNTEHEQNVTHVAVAVIVKGDRVLISRRADHVYQGGLWEFPGGKVERGETGDQALLREIKEELGIDIINSRPLINITHHYTDKSVVLDTYLILQFKGNEYAFDTQGTAVEGQPVRWVQLSQLYQYQFPEANNAILKALSLPECYLISPDQESSDDHEQFLHDFSQSCRFYKLIQLRIKTLKHKPLNKLVAKCLAIAQKNGVAVLLNSVLLKSGMLLDTVQHNFAAGFHLTGRHLHDSAYVNRLKEYYPDKYIAASCHCIEDIKRANELKLDFIVVSPVKKTTSHPKQQPIGWLQFNLLAAVARMPVFALGGMQIADIHKAQSYGAQGIAAISSLWGKN